MSAQVVGIRPPPCVTYRGRKKVERDMGFKFTVSSEANKMLKRTNEGRSIIDTLEQLNSMEIQLVKDSYELTELTDCLENIQFSINLIDQLGTDGIKALNTDYSLESFVGAYAIVNKQRATAALENKFTDAVKNIWKKIKEFFARLYDWFRKIFFSLEGDLKHLEKMVDSGNDKNFNPNTMFENPVPTQKAFMVLLQGTNATAEFTKEFVTKLEPIFAKLAPLMQKQLNENKDVYAAAASGERPLHTSDIKVVPGLNELEGELKKLVVEWHNAAKSESNPLLKVMAPYIEEVQNSKVDPHDPITVLQYVNANYLRSGTAAELGYKTGADVRAVVTEFAKSVRMNVAMASTIQKLVNDAAKVADAALDVYQKAGVPKDFVVLIRQATGYLGKMSSFNAKLSRWIILYVTRAVRRMYN